MRISHTEKPVVSSNPPIVSIWFSDELTVTMTEAQAWALQDALRSTLSSSAANHKCPECGGLGAPSHPCPKTSLTCSCCFKCTQKCVLARDLDEQADESREELKVWDICIGDGLETLV